MTGHASQAAEQVAMANALAIRVHHMHTPSEIDLPPAPFSRSDFGRDFVWGAATSAYQIEGAWDAEGKSPSIWDTFTHTRGLPFLRHVKNGENGDVACDSYNRYEEDVELLARMGMNAYRFSLAWTRLIPEP